MIRNQQDEAYQMSLEADRRKVSHSHTPDYDFCKIISLPACGKDKKPTAAHRSHTGRRSICDVVVMLKVHHHVASQCIQDFMEVFSCFFQYKMRYLVVSKKNNPLFV